MAGIIVRTLYRVLCLGYTELELCYSIQFPLFIIHSRLIPIHLRLSLELSRKACHTLSAQLAKLWLLHGHESSNGFSKGIALQNCSKFSHLHLQFVSKVSLYSINRSGSKMFKYDISDAHIVVLTNMKTETLALNYENSMENNFYLCVKYVISICTR
jgi:hypothetical protein